MISFKAFYSPLQKKFCFTVLSLKSFKLCLINNFSWRKFSYENIFHTLILPTTKYILIVIHTYITPSHTHTHTQKLKPIILKFFCQVLAQYLSPPLLTPHFTHTSFWKEHLEKKFQLQTLFSHPSKYTSFF